MLTVHKLIDAALGRDPRCQFIAKHGTAQNTVVNLVRAAVEAEKFDFGQIVLERKGDKFELPDLTVDEKEMWVRGYLPLPAPICWYEYSLGERRVGMLVVENIGMEDYKITRKDTGEDTHPWVVMRVDRRGDDFVWDGVLCAIHRTEQDWNADHWHYIKGGNKEIDFQEPEVQNSVAADIMMSIYLTMMINSKTTEVRSEPAPEKLNKAREKRSQTPLFEHRVVNIVPVRYLRDAEREAQGTHASPKLHWRRTHARTYHRGSPSEFIRVIWRFLVGRADRGTVSKEYRVLHDKGSKSA